MARPPRQSHVVHGEPAAAQVLAGVTRAQLGWSVSVAREADEVEV